MSGHLWCSLARSCRSQVGKTPRDLTKAGGVANKLFRCRVLGILPYTMSMSFAQSPPQSPSAHTGAGPGSSQRHRRVSTQGSFASFTSNEDAMLHKSSYDAYRPSGQRSNSREVPTSPTASSTTSNGERSPRSFYSFAQASTSTIKQHDYASLVEEDDLGDRTFMLQDETPKKPDSSIKGKGRAEDLGASERTLQEPFTEVDDDLDQDNRYADEDEDSARIEQVSRSLTNLRSG